MIYIEQIYKSQETHRIKLKKKAFSSSFYNKKNNLKFCKSFFFLHLVNHLLIVQPRQTRVDSHPMNMDF